MYNDRMDVELYLIHTGFLDKEEVFNKKLKQVCSKRREKVLKLKIQEDRKRSLAAGLLLEQVIGERGYCPDEVAVDENGKLYLPGTDDFFFSLSHSGEYAACAVCDVPVGADIQKTKEVRKNLAKRFFHKEEIKRIENIPKEEQEKMFFRYWTGKESYLKLTGKGIAGGFDSFYVDLEEMRIIDRQKQEKEIYLKEYNCLDDYYITVACYSSAFLTFVKKIYYRL